MSDISTLEFNGNSAQQVALCLLRLVARVEGKDLDKRDGADRKWILDTYAECLKTVWAPEQRLAESGKTCDE